MFKTNTGNIDRIVRVVIGLALLGWYFFAGGPIWATGALGFCGLYTLLGINTCKLKN